MLRIGTSAICTDIDRVHRIRMEYTKRIQEKNKIHHSEIQAMESAKTISECHTKKFQRC